MPAAAAERRLREGKAVAWEDAPEDLRRALADGQRDFPDAEAAAWTPAHPLVWYPPRVPEARKALVRDAAGRTTSPSRRAAWCPSAAPRRSRSTSGT